ncbi:MAG: biopolymer transporter ExbD [Kiritimatiellae bacterium]|jgi:biopolymer transport protein ExbD|nr:biopolymer transporter ExbD [Kiritimatiellia bacterium]NLD90273.1 biopolymer transporter ExbD [Lentisphaerota bacterium]HOU21931.1 biopolymer transporter ExbD [Kiritimatiellia bacterium]HPC18741.1 biopolymer transporter ExbD [Kiritimatiellia bacterium]HQN80255.1 biopolymer transporter ExbD [Kiritimatiellia bacterium]
MNFQKKSLFPVNPGVPLTPMIDVVFLLLCFFVTSQIFAQWETEIDITLPTAATGSVPQRLPGEVIINVRADGTTVVNGQVLDAAGLRSMMDRLVELFPGQPVLLRADKTTAYEHVVRVLDTCRQADLWNISFATLAPGS